MKGKIAKITVVGDTINDVNKKLHNVWDAVTVERWSQ
jgi:hypothetical protein